MNQLSFLQKTSASLIAFLCLTACEANESSTAEPSQMPNETTSISKTNTPYSANELRHYSERPITDDIIYFLLPDRFYNGNPTNDYGGIEGNISDHGFDPTHKGFYHGGDLDGVTKKLDYIQSLGATAIWITPIYKNKPVQGEGELMSSGYHGYWITDFMAVDPHLGGNDALKTLVDAAHARNMKVILDIVTNHTADVIKYRECHDPDFEGQDKQADGNCAYRSKAEYPYTLYKGQSGKPLNSGFAGDNPEFQTVENFEKLTRTDFAYTPYIPKGEENSKNPAWLNDISLYHNRGETTFEGENSIYGDFFGLDDVFTEHPKVVEGFTDIFKTWISDYKIDGFRVDTTKHVNDSFWQKIVPPLLEHAKAEGIPNFYIFGEVYDFSPEGLSRFTQKVGLPAVLDFGFAGTAIDVIAKGQPTRKLETIFSKDSLYGQAASKLPTFVSNHDMGRMAHMMKQAMADISDEEAFKRIRLANALLLFSRGVPVLYYGDEQGFVGDGGDQAAREDMFESLVDSYNDNDLIATDKTTRNDNFDPTHPLFKEIAALAQVYHQTPALRNGKQKTILSEDSAGLFAFERSNEKGRDRILVAINTASDIARALPISNMTAMSTIETIIGSCTPSSDSNQITIAPLDFAVCKINEK